MAADCRSSMIYCVIPQDLASRHHEELRSFYAAEPRVAVVVERRAADRRVSGERRAPARRVGGGRRVWTGRRLRDRRARSAREVPVRRPPLAPRDIGRIRFIEVEDPPGRAAEDLDAVRLVRLAQEGDGVAFTALYLRYFPRVYSYLMTMLGDQHEAEDAAQEVFERMHRALPRYRQTGAPFRAWLFRIARNGGLERLRRRVPVPEDPHVVLTSREQRERAADPIAPAELFDRDVLYVAERLPEEQRRVLFLRYSADLSQEEAGRVLGKSPEAVRKLEARAKAFLRERLTAGSGRSVGRA